MFIEPLFNETVVLEFDNAPKRSKSYEDGPTNWKKAIIVKDHGDETYDVSFNKNKNNKDKDEDDDEKYVSKYIHRYV